MTAMFAASVAAVSLVLGVTLAVGAPSSAAAVGRFTAEPRTPADLRNIALLESVGELNDAEDGRLVGLTQTGSDVDEDEPEMLEDGASAVSMFEERKRPWGKTNMALWGKRRSSMSFQTADDDTVEKRKWGQKNMPLWGKRSENNFRFPVGRFPVVPAAAAEKRKWGQKNMALWGR